MGIEDKAKLFSTSPALSPEARAEFAKSRADLIEPLIRAGYGDNYDSRMVKRIFKGKITPDQIVDSFGEVSEYAKSLGIEKPGHYFFDDVEMSYIGPFETPELALLVATENLRMAEKYFELFAKAQRSEHEIQQTLGKALGYPWYKDDQQNFPEATEASGVFVGEHTAASLAMQAAEYIDGKRNQTGPDAVCEDATGGRGATGTDAVPEGVSGEPPSTASDEHTTS